MCSSTILNQRSKKHKTIEQPRTKMTGFSFTAPQISEEDEQRERDLLSKEERQKIQNDLYGLSVDLKDETEEMLQSAPRLMQQALMEIPVEEKSEYLEALERCRDLVAKESPPLPFMRCDHYDANAAARRLIGYWRCRRFFFGADKAFLPMTIDGAMQDDVDVLQKGIVHILPDDEHGRAVLFIDRTQMCEPHATRDQIYRITFYALQLMSIRESVQKLGWVACLNCEGFDIYKHMNRIRLKKLVHCGMACMPLHLRAAHFFCGRNTTLFTMALPVFKFIVGRQIRDRLIFHGGSGDNFRTHLEQYGLKEENLSRIIGGGFDNSNLMPLLKESELPSDEDAAAHLTGKRVCTY